MVAWIAAAIPDFFLGLMFVRAWISPNRFEDEFLRWLILIMAVEFVLLPATTLLAIISVIGIYPAVRVSCIVMTAPVFAFAVIFTLSWSRAEQNWWIFAGTMIVLGTRALPAVVGVKTRHDAIATTVYTLLCCLAFVLSILAAFEISTMGGTQEVVFQLGVENEQHPGGHFAWGALFFPAAGIVTIVSNPIASAIERHLWPNAQ